MLALAIVIGEPPADLAQRRLRAELRDAKAMAEEIDRDHRPVGINADREDERHLQAVFYDAGIDRLSRSTTLGVSQRFPFGFCRVVVVLRAGSPRHGHGRALRRPIGGAARQIAADAGSGEQTKALDQRRGRLGLLQRRATNLCTRVADRERQEASHQAVDRRDTLTRLPITVGVREAEQAHVRVENRLASLPGIIGAAENVACRLEVFEEEVANLRVVDVPCVSHLPHRAAELVNDPEDSRMIFDTTPHAGARGDLRTAEPVAAPRVLDQDVQARPDVVFAEARRRQSDSVYVRAEICFRREEPASERADERQRPGKCKRPIWLVTRGGDPFDQVADQARYVSQSVHVSFALYGGRDGFVGHGRPVVTGWNGDLVRVGRRRGIDEGRGHSGSGDRSRRRLRRRRDGRGGVSAEERFDACGYRGVVERLVATIAHEFDREFDSVREIIITAAVSFHEAVGETPATNAR